MQRQPEHARRRRFDDLPECGVEVLGGQHQNDKTFAVSGGSQGDVPAIVGRFANVVDEMHLHFGFLRGVPRQPDSCTAKELARSTIGEIHRELAPSDGGIDADIRHSCWFGG